MHLEALCCLIISGGLFTASVEGAVICTDASVS